MTELKKCSCKHEYQDAKYGYGVRVHNKTANGDWRCTVCKREIKKDSKQS